jgi:hypothetical protein
VSEPVRYSEAWAKGDGVHVVDFDWGGRSWTRTYVMHSVPGHESRWDAHAHLFERGCTLLTQYIGPDGLWRGSGMEVAGG